MLAGVACAFGTVGHVRQSVSGVRRMERRTLEEFEEVSEVSNMSIYFPSFASCSLVLIDLATDFTW